MKMKKISFLVAAHNEEKIIGKTLENLIKIPYDNYEIIIGLDGCTDKTEEIVKLFSEKSKKIKYFKLNLRQGKNAVINSIIKKASGEIIIVNDADWLFQGSKEQFGRMIRLFDNPEVGGMSESLPLEWNKEIMQNCNIGFRMVAYSSYLWYEFQKEKFTKNADGLSILKEPALFITNIFRKEIYEDNSSLADDFERTRDIMKKGFFVIIGKDVPKMNPIYNKVAIKDLFRQKIRTAMARNQLKAEGNVGQAYYLSSALYILGNSWKFGINIGIMMLFWVVITSLATIIAKFKKLNTKEGWMMRMER